MFCSSYAGGTTLYLWGQWSNVDPTLILTDPTTLIQRWAGLPKRDMLGSAALKRFTTVYSVSVYSDGEDDGAKILKERAIWHTQHTCCVRSQSDQRTQRTYSCMIVSSCWPVVCWRHIAKSCLIFCLHLSTAQHVSTNLASSSCIAANAIARAEPFGMPCICGWAEEARCGCAC